jgi:hypothetical protein
VVFYRTSPDIRLAQRSRIAENPITARVWLTTPRKEILWL